MTPSGIPACGGDVGESERAQRRQLRGLEHDGVSGRERRAELPGGDHQREVPRHDQPDDAERLADRERLAAGDGNRLSQQALRGARVVTERVDHHSDLAARVADWLARVTGLEHRELVALCRQRVRQRVQQTRAFARRDCAPRWKGGGGALDGGVDIVRVGARYLCEHRLGGGLDDGQPGAHGRPAM